MVREVAGRAAEERVVVVREVAMVAAMAVAEKEEGGRVVEETVGVELEAVALVVAATVAQCPGKCRGLLLRMSGWPRGLSLSLLQGSHRLCFALDRMAPLSSCGRLLWDCLLGAGVCAACGGGGGGGDGADGEDGGSGVCGCEQALSRIASYCHVSFSHRTVCSRAPLRRGDCIDQAAAHRRTR